MNTKPLALFTMLPPFYDPPLYKDVKIYLNRIEEEFSIKIKSYSYLQTAFANDVFIINDQIIFRFPKPVEKLRNHLKYEIDFLNFLEDKVNIHIPRYNYISSKGDFAGYEIIPGEVLTASLIATMSRKSKEQAVNQLINFINQFHSIKVRDFKRYKPTNKSDYIKTEKRVEEELKNRLFPKLSKKEVKVIQDFYQEAKELLARVPSNCPIHGDLYVSNVIWNELPRSRVGGVSAEAESSSRYFIPGASSEVFARKNKVNSKIGAIDFGDYLIGDPAKDFEVFFDFGDEYVEMAYKKYNGVKDNEFLQRAQVYYKVHGIYTLLSSLLGAHISYDYGYKNFFKRKFNL